MENVIEKIVAMHILMKNLDLCRIFKKLNYVLFTKWENGIIILIFLKFHQISFKFH